MSEVTFDESFPRLITTLLDLSDATFVEAGIVIRDASGRLSFVANREPKDDDERNRLTKAVTDSLGAYARNDKPVRFKGDAGTETLLSQSDALPVQMNGNFYRLLDRRIVGSGWLDTPVGEVVTPPRVVFATLKGGVGRSTALAIAAADFARDNLNVLVVDLDLEAPGLGDLLLNDDCKPEFGVIDYLVENGLGGVDDRDLHNYIATSALTFADSGRVDVLPALGRRAINSPENTLPKLARAMIDDIVDGASVSVAKQISTMIERVTSRGQYDVVLIDSRAGLAELAAPAVLGLGATVLLFGTCQRQTFEGYRALFASLQLLAQRDKYNEVNSEWRNLLRPVYAKASIGNNESEKIYIDEMFDLYSDHIYDAEVFEDNSNELLRYVRDDESAPHWPLIIPFNQAFLDFDPSRTLGQLSEAFYEQTYRPFLSSLRTIITAAEESSKL